MQPYITDLEDMAATRMTNRELEHELDRLRRTWPANEAREQELEQELENRG